MFCFLQASGVYVSEQTEAGWKPLERITAIPGDSSQAWAPYLAPDGKAIFFSNEDLNVTRRTESGWSSPQRISEPVNSASEEFGFGLAADQTLYFCSHRSGGHGGCDVWCAPCVDGAWPKAANLGDVINTEHNDCGAAIAPDQSFMVFWSNRPGGYGNYDLYVTQRQPDGNWSEPRNLGETINTRAYEMAASITPDGKYLFFTRFGREADIYWVDVKAFLTAPTKAVNNQDCPRILCYGDSITHRGTWLATVESRIDVKMINAGRSGRRASQAKAQLAPYLEKYDDLDQIILFLGVNDLPARDKRPGIEKVAGCVADMNEAIDLALTRFEPNDIILVAPCTVNPETMSAVNLEKGYQVTPPLLEQLEKDYQALAKQRGVSFMSLLHVVSKDHYLDGLHPNQDGNDEIAAAISAYLKKHIVRSQP